MPGSLRTALVVVILAVTVLVVGRILFGGPDPQVGKCVDAGNELVDCDDGGALFELVREVDSGRDCPPDSLKLFQFRSDLFCGVALNGAPAPSSEYVSCLLLAGAELADDAGDLRFATGPRTSSGEGSGTISVEGEDWRIYYILSKGQLDPGVAAVLANPAKAAFVAYIDDGAERADEVKQAEACSPTPSPEAG